MLGIIFSPKLSIEEQSDIQLKYFDLLKFCPKFKSHFSLLPNGSFSHFCSYKATGSRNGTHSTRLGFTTTSRQVFLHNSWLVAKMSSFPATSTWIKPPELAHVAFKSQGSVRRAASSKGSAKGLAKVLSDSSSIIALF